jgi:hypothetical protein
MHSALTCHSSPQLVAPTLKFLDGHFHSMVRVSAEPFLLTLVFHLQSFEDSPYLPDAQVFLGTLQKNRLTPLQMTST